MTLTFGMATAEDSRVLAELHTAVGEALTARYGSGHWSSKATEAGVLRALRETTVLVARDGPTVVGTLRLATKKPWAIDVKYFTPVKKTLYLINMAVTPARQRGGVGRALVAEAAAVARVRGVGSIRLDAYDADAGAGGFYAKCGYAEVGRVSYKGVPLIYYEQVF